MHEDSPDVAFPVGPAIVVALSKREGRWGRRYIFTPLRPHGANLATKRRASIWDLGHAPCLQRGMKERERERVVRCHVQWPRDPLTNLSPSWCSKITETRLRSCTNNSSNGSLFYYPSPSLPFPRIGREKGRRQRDSSGKIRVRFKYV